MIFVVQRLVELPITLVEQVERPIAQSLEELSLDCAKVDLGHGEPRKRSRSRWGRPPSEAPQGAATASPLGLAGGRGVRRLTGTWVCSGR